MRALLLALGEPQRGYPIAHIAGTSGKGSVSAMVAAVSGAAGLRVGVHMTPYLQSPLEKLAVGERLATPEEFVELVAWIRSRLEALEGDDPDFAPRYGSAWVALTFEFFRRRQVDLTVLEAGVGGRFDLTNVVLPAVAAVTSIGKDHLTSLGPTVEDVAHHKGGVFKPGVPAVAIERPGVEYAILKRCALEAGAPLSPLREGVEFVGSGGLEPSFSYRGVNLEVRDVPLGLKGAHQIQNAAVASAVCDSLAGSGFPLTDEALRAGLAGVRLPGRWEVVERAPEVILDGAHNPDKAAALRAALLERRRGRRLALVLGVLGYKAAGEIVAGIVPGVDLVVATEPHVYEKAPTPARELAALARRHGVKVAVRPDPLQALDAALDFAGRDGLVCVTGSLYLVGQVRNRWFPAEEIALQGTSWPEISAAPRASAPTRHVS